MTHILAQSVYGLDLKDLPLQRLVKEESMIGRRHRIPSAAPTELSPTNFNSFSDIKANTSVYTHPAVGSQSAEERRSQAMRYKSQTVDVPQSPDSPQQQVRSRRYVSIPVEGGEPYSLSVNTLSAGGGSGRKSERSVSEVKSPAGGQDIPARPSSSEGHYGTIKEEEEGVADVLSPPISLPGTVVFGGTSNEPGNPPPLALHLSERADDGVDLSEGHQRGQVEESPAISDRPAHINLGVTDQTALNANGAHIHQL